MAEPCCPSLASTPSADGGEPLELRAIARPGLVVAFVVPARPSEPTERQQLGCWLHIGDDGMAEIHTGKVEVGQGVRTSLAQLIAEELRVPPDAVRMVMGDTDEAAWDIGTFSSMSIRIAGTQLRRVAATARERLLCLATDAWDVERGELTFADGLVGHPPTGRLSGFGALVSGRRELCTVSRTDAVTVPSSWTRAGRAAARAGGVEHVTGAHRYASDIALTGMACGKVLRPPAFGATLVALDTTAAAAQAGVRIVREDDFVGVIAAGEREAARALAAIDSRWRLPAGQPATLAERLRTDRIEVAGRGGSFRHTAGSVERGCAGAPLTLATTYTTAFVAHAPMEPRAAVARWSAGRLTVWTGTQRPFLVRRELASACGIPEHRVRVVVPDTGGAFGGKHAGDAAVEAARLARAAGCPVRVLWTRREEFTSAYFRPAAVIDVESAIGADGRIAAWRCDTFNAGSDAIVPPYEIPNQQIEYHPSRTVLRQGAYRALAATANTFARETHLDELARALRIDPLELRCRNLADERLVAVLRAAACAFGWSERCASPGRGYGLAAGVEKGGYVATCVEVEAGPSREDVRVVRVVEAYECGAIVNPDHLRGQVEGAVIQGLGGALFEAVEFEDGRVLNASFADYRVPRFGDVPPIDVVLLDRRDLPSAGAGETPIIGIAPAIGNAIFDATNDRRRSLPLAAPTTAGTPTFERAPAVVGGR